MEKSNSTQGRVYYAYTKPRKYALITATMLVELVPNAKPVKLNNTCSVEGFTGRRGSIALEFDGEQFVYGVSICSNEDTFDKELGRKLAKQRMIEKFACIPAEGLKDFFSAIEKERGEPLTDHQKATMVLMRVSDKVTNKINTSKYARMIESHRIAKGELQPKSDK